ncbi:hypothetical protein PACILC2_31650 [Paenibacillus cisolokensis]|uniref:Inosine/uridine-preferring nucleoside hydrolase domain-containing protein n=1 Tax=Paenibacillus cisolokensis TaxID=1658519 RepID=A0ABQ4N8R8_9BACL|nr:nucleoside hydrolase [Paenibacillus cisolokensis]GIQ64597.1 hypothetical protein PACILC2_31650 [Paenibacillus cisolokensis]
MKFPVLSDEFRVKRLAPPKGKTVRMVLDTDTYNEIDDQFAVVYALKSPDRLRVEALYAAPFFNELSSGPADGMEKSYDELLRIVGHLGITPERFVYKGARTYLPGAFEPAHSEAALDLVERAMASSDDDPLYVTAIGAITNVASAILIEPRIIEKIVVVWLGGHALHWPNTNEFNLQQDVHAARVVFDSGVPLVLVPCMGVASHLQTTLAEIKAFVQGRGAIGNFLHDTFERCSKDHFGYSRVIWDISTVAYLIEPDWVPTTLAFSPVLTDQLTWSTDASRHLIRYAFFAHRDPIFKDLFRKIARDRD